MKRQDIGSLIGESSDLCDLRDLKKVLHDLLEHSPNPSRFLEVYYWSGEPGLAEFMRQFLLLPTPARLALAAFMSMTQDASDSVAVTIGNQGQLTLSSLAVSDAIKMRTLTSVPGEPSESVH